MQEQEHRVSLKSPCFNVLSLREGNCRNKGRLKTGKHNPPRYILLESLELENTWNSFFPVAWTCHSCSICGGRKLSSLHSLKRCLVHKEGMAVSVTCKEWPSNAKHILVSSISRRHIQNPRVLTFSYVHCTFSFALHRCTISKHLHNIPRKWITWAIPIALHIEQACHSHPVQQPAGHKEG